MGSASINVKERGEKERKVRRAKKRKGIEAQRTKHPTQPHRRQLIKNGTENGRKRTKKKEQGSGSPTQLPWNIHPPPPTRRDHAALETVLFTPTPQGG